MWDSRILEIKTPGQLIAKIFQVEDGTNDNSQVGNCCVCNMEYSIQNMKKASKVLSNSFGGYSQLYACSVEVNSFYICKYCELVIADKGQAEVPIVDSHAAIAYWNGEGFKKFKTINKNSRSELTEFLFKPPIGAFLIAFNKPFFGGKRSHYLNNAVVNYNFGDCKKYIATYLDKRFIIDIDNANKYIDLVSQFKQKVRVPDSLVFYRRIKKSDSIKQKKIRDLISMIENIGEEFFIENAYLIRVLNVLI